MGFIKDLSKHYSFKRIWKLLFLHIAKLPMPGHGIRPLFVKWGGVKIQEWKTVFIGTGVEFDTVAPQRIHIGEGSVITGGTVILTHYMNSQTGKWSVGDVYIGRNVFIGMNTIITKSIMVGDNSIIGAGSIVAKDIPANEVWAGNPVRFIRKREIRN